MAEVLGFEPKMTESESGVLPLHYTSILNFREKCLSNFLLISIRVTILIWAMSLKSLSHKCPKSHKNDFGILKLAVS